MPDVVSYRAICMAWLICTVAIQPQKIKQHVTYARAVESETAKHRRRKQFLVGGQTIFLYILPYNIINLMSNKQFLLT